MKGVQIPNGAIKVPLPGVRQKLKASCGAASLQSICAYFNVGPSTQQEYIDQLGTTPNGTHPSNIVDFARRYGLNVLLQENMTLKQLFHHLELGHPVVCAIQAWGSKIYYSTHQSGHYLTGIGYCNKYIYFEDPYIECYRGYLTHREFNKRWHDFNGRLYDHLGIAIWKRKSLSTCKKVH